MYENTKYCKPHNSYFNSVIFVGANQLNSAGKPRANPKKSGLNYPNNGTRSKASLDSPIKVTFEAKKAKKEVKREPQRNCNRMWQSVRNKSNMKRTADIA